jgi:hypothetical protein
MNYLRRKLKYMVKQTQNISIISRRKYKKSYTFNSYTDSDRRNEAEKHTIQVSENDTKQYTSLFDTISLLSPYQAANKPDQSNIQYNIQ